MKNPLFKNSKRPRSVEGSVFMISLHLVPTLEIGSFCRKDCTAVCRPRVTEPLGPGTRSLEI